MNIVIDRLTLDIPGLDAAAGARLARLVGERMAGVDWGGVQSGQRLKPITLDHTDKDLSRLATRIVEALRQQIGGGAP